MKIIGFIMLEKLQNNPFYMDYFAIKKEYQNQGLGTNAKGLFIEIEKVIDDLPNTLKRASFYERLDFKSTNSTYKLFNVLYTPYYWSKDIVYSKIEKGGDNEQKRKDICNYNNFRFTFYYIYIFI